MVSGNALPVPAGPQKHRACDECRFRKIACSKEPDGCQRCQKEGIACVYSPQKPMGRPRKRRHEEDPASSVGSVSVSMTAAQPASLVGPASASSLALAAVASLPFALASAPASAPVTVAHSSALLADVAVTSSYGDAGHYRNQLQLHNAAAHRHNHHQHPVLSTDPTDHALDLFSQSLLSGTPYLDLLPDYETDDSKIFGIVDNADFTYFPRDGQGLFDGVGMAAIDVGQADPLEGINFDEADPSVAAMPKGLNNPPQGYTVPLYLQTPALSEPSPSTHSSSCFEPLGSTGTDATPPELGHARPHTHSCCDCVSSLYLAIGSLNRLPSDVLSAIHVAREATETANNTINCIQCYRDMYDLSKPPPISRFQSMMCIGSLVHSACDAYSSILKMVNRDTERARQELQMLYFSCKEVGGIWTTITDGDCLRDNLDYALLKSYNDRYLEPDTWRRTMLTILRVEVYGFNSGMTSVASLKNYRSSPCSHVNAHRGLRDIITLLDEKNRKRHDIAKALLQAGQLHTIACSRYFSTSGLSKTYPLDDRHCLRMLDAAKMALNNLVMA